MDSYCIYIIKSVNFEHYYIGSTSNVNKRVDEHNSSRAKWTKRYQPWVLVHTEEFSTRGEAVKRERILKSIKNIKKFLESKELVRILFTN